MKTNVLVVDDDTMIFTVPDELDTHVLRYELADVRLSDALRTLTEVVLSIDPDCGHDR